ncbi:MAG: PKD domain-containing protein [Thermodesulfobacteriota bacterium]
MNRFRNNAEKNNMWLWRLQTSLFHVVIMLVLTLAAGTAGEAADIIIDNGDSGTSATGTWLVSTALDPYGADSVYAKNNATYTYSFTAPTTSEYEVSAWWTYFSNRVSSAPIRIQHASGTTTVYVNQRLNGGQWNSLGTFSFVAGITYTITITGANSTYTTCADAMKFTEIVNTLPPAADFSADRTTGMVPATIQFSDRSTGGIPTDWLWDFGDGQTSTGQNPSHVYEQEGVYTVTLTAANEYGSDMAVKTAYITITAGTGGDPGEIIIDNGDYGTSATGTWLVSTALDPYGVDSVYAKNNAAYTYSFTAPKTSEYEVSAWWTYFSNRVSSAPIRIQHASGTTTVYVNQRLNGGQWNSLGTFSFVAGITYTVTITGANSTYTTCADAVKFTEIINTLPPAADFSADRTTGVAPATIQFTDQSEGGIPTEWLWDFGDGQTSTEQNPAHVYEQEGVYTVSLTATNGFGNDTAVKTAYITITAGTGGDPGEVIIDNGDNGTSFTGTWLVSTAVDPYGVDSVYAKNNAAYTYTFIPSTTAEYEVSAWWTYFSNRVTNAPIRIQHAGGTATVYVNQRLNGGQWNSLGTFSFVAGVVYTVTITGANSTYTTCADAVKFTEIINTLPPAADFSANKTIGGAPATIQFTDLSSGGNATEWLWDFGDGQTSTEQNPAHVYEQEGEYTVSLTAANEFGSDTMVKAAYIKLTSASENIYCVEIYGGITDYAEVAGQSLSRYGAVKVDGIWRYTNPNTGVTYFLHPVTTQEQFLAAVREEGAVILIRGHSNYGLGLTFPPFNTALQNVRYVDDNLIFNCSSHMVDVSTAGLRYSQAYPNWTPIYQDGTDAIWPYAWDDPAGRTPAYNYYLTYTLPGDPTHYRVESSSTGKYLERFAGSGPAWYSPTGAKPDPVSNPEVFIANTRPEYSHVEHSGNWAVQKDATLYGIAGYTFSYTPNQTIADTFTYTLTFYAPRNPAGTYDFKVTYDPEPTNDPAVTYTIQQNNTVLGTVTLNQQEPAGTPAGSYVLASLGTFSVAEGAVTVTLTGSGSGWMIADGLAAFNPAIPWQFFAVDNNDEYRSHFEDSRYGNKTILDTTNCQDIRPEDCKYKMMFFNTCFSGKYFIDSFHQGRMFYTNWNSENGAEMGFIKRYVVDGYSDQQLLDYVNSVHPGLYEYYDFTKLPPSMR